MSDRGRPSPRLPDEEARRTTRERFDRAVLLEAGAGTGKTRALVERILSWALDAGWSDAEERRSETTSRPGQRPAEREIGAEVLGGIVAITFTEAAAAEMASRLGAALSAMAGGAATSDGAEIVERIGAERARERAAALAEQLDRARIQTIHAFCRGILAAFPFEAGLHPEFRVDADGERTEAVATEVLSARLAERLGGGDADWVALLSDRLQPRDLLEALVAALRAGVEPGELEDDPFPSDRVAAAFGAAAAGLGPLVGALGAVAPRLAARSRARQLEPELRELAAELDPPPAGDRVAPISARAGEILEGSGAALREWSRGSSIARIEKLLEGEQTDFAGLAAQALGALRRLVGLDPEARRRAGRVLGELVRETRSRLRREGLVSFDELLLGASRLLERRPDVCRTVRRGIRQLLVDEFQDTDRRQCDLISSLALDPPAAERPGLFVVGDPKQSIYGWRSADLEAYETFLIRAEATGALRRRLEVNFRSTPAILDEVERVLAPAFVPEPGMQPPYEPLQASERGVLRGRERADRPGVEYWLSIGREAGGATGSGAASRIEARAIALDLLEQRRDDPSLGWSDFALLARSGSDLEVYLQALREHAVPFEVERDRSYWRRREIIDAAAAVRAIVDPGDHLALVTFLRSPFVGIPDAAWLPLWRERLPERIDNLLEPDPERLASLRELLGRVAAELPADVPGLDEIAGWEESAFAALEALAELRSRLGREPAEVFVERLRCRLGLEPMAAARFLGRFGLANLERFLRDLERALESAGDDPASIVRFLRRAVGERREAEEARPPESGSDAVRVLTIHRAKGLEFRQVFLLQTHKGRGREPAEPAFDHRRGAGGEGIESVLFGLRTPGWGEVLERRETLAERERVRLLYVAATRARERLVVAGQLFSTRGRDGSFLPLLEDRLANGPLAALPQGETRPTLDATGALWRAPALEAGWDSERAPRGRDERPAPEDPARLAGDLDALTERRRRARERSERPRVVRASELARHPGSPPQPGAAPDERSARPLARARGIGLHRALELAGSEEARSQALLAFRAALPGATGEELEGFSAALLQLEAGSLWRRLLELAPDVVARELPVLVAAAPDRGDPASDALSGTLDLLYRDRGSGQLVVADFKSDALADETEIDELVARYRPQLLTYARAVRAAADDAVRLEIWLLAADRIVPVPGASDDRESG